MKKFTILLTAIIILALLWVAIVLNAAYGISTEKTLFFNSSSVQLKVIYILGIAINASFLMLLFSRKNNHYL